MWDVINRTAFEADTAVIRDHNGGEVWVVVVKGTFAILSDGSTAPAEKQVEVLHTPRFLADPADSSMIYDIDVVARKPHTDVLLNACAYTDRGRPVRSVECGFTLGTLRKQLQVFGNRQWRSAATSLSISDPEPFERLPIVYERAFGGRDRSLPVTESSNFERRNPVGVGFLEYRETAPGSSLPNVEWPQQPIRSYTDRPPPAGFGALGYSWSPRAELSGTFDEVWQAKRYPLLPSDFDERFFQCAPADQQCRDPLMGGEPVELRNLTREGLMRFRVPYVPFGCTTTFGGGLIDQSLAIHTVIIEPEFPRVIVVWYAAMPCHGRSLKIKEATVWVKPRRRAHAASSGVELEEA